MEALGDYEYYYVADEGLVGFEGGVSAYASGNVFDECCCQLDVFEPWVVNFFSWSFDVNDVLIDVCFGHGFD